MPGHKYTRETITQVTHWVPQKLFSFRVTRPAGFSFVAGQFARLGLPADDAPGAAPEIWRAYSMVSAPQHDMLEFYSIVVPGGQFTPRLARLAAGDAIYVDQSAFGFLTLDRFEPGGNLWLIATGTGLSAYLSLLQDPNTWLLFDRIILVHGVRQAAELAYRKQILDWVANGPPCPQAKSLAKLAYLPIATRETLDHTPRERITTLIASGQLETLAGCALDPAKSKVMLCGNPDMLLEARKLLSERGFAVGRRGSPGNLALENYW
ncbi:ferredoxin--NADP reductase [Pollutimonas bauzanensis]|uniref:ferredoxin--NADP(+) reductase n=1 Tax=Pollutimonas bauzanensis TaxID=658167 RepID=A0A1M5ZWN7_9BURK|nr:ferredoxin--NADP reductase [Pollutimonas bauzanensis]SHI28449.1 ferredoxin--NADP+ reductase [Pollutimonas bauzanensis]